MNAMDGAHGRLWSLWDMMRIYAHHYFALGERAKDIEHIFNLAENDIGGKEVKPEEIDVIKDGIEKLLNMCQDLDLSTSTVLLQSRLFDPPKTRREFKLVMEAVYSELKTRTFIYMRPNLARFYENHDVLSANATLAFPSSRDELWEASNCLAAGLWTAAVFHSMRAAEVGVRVLGKELGVCFPDKPLELAEWQQILDQIDLKVKALSQKPRSPERSDDQEFYSKAASEFRYFKDGWRVRVAHAHTSYGEVAAVKIFEHTRDFFETLVGRLKE